MVQWIQVMNSAAGRRILVVDDEPSIRAIVAETLEEEGYQVQTASNGQEALDLVRCIPPDAVVLDMMMPVMDGWTFLQACREDPKCADLRVMCLSAAPTAAADAARLGAKACMTKPFDLDALLSTIQQLIDGEATPHDHPGDKRLS